MLKQLTIKNVALISELQVEFDKNLCVLTGETGAGKSIIVDSLAFVLGSKADKTLIKSGEEKAVVEAVFEIDEEATTYSIMQELGLSPEEIIVLHRTMNLQGKNECRVNGKICPLSVLKSIAHTLVDIFGQNEHVNFLQASTHLKIIDEFKKFPDYDNLEQVVAEYKQQQNLLEQFGGSESDRERTLSILEYEINEIEKANLIPDEEETLIAKKDKIVNVEKIAEALKSSLSHLRDSANIPTEIWMASSSLQSVAKYDEEFLTLTDRIQTLKYELDDVIDTLDAKLYDCNYDPNELDTIIYRLEEIKRLKRKYGKTIPDVLDFLQQSKQKYSDLIDASAKIEKIENNLSNLKLQAYNLSQKLKDFRQKSAIDFCKLIYEELKDLGMPYATFSMHFDEAPHIDDFEPSLNGFDQAEFMFSANKGEPQKPLTKVISGGETSRFLLAIKSVTAKIENIPTMIFDEIDVGLSGNVAQMVAKKLANISRRFQCLVITHLPQVASMGDSNYYIKKTVENDKTYTSIELVDQQLKIKEVERLMGGTNISQYSQKHAQEMILWADEYKNNIN